MLDQRLRPRSFSATTWGRRPGSWPGAFSESTVIGTAGDAIQRLAIPDAEKTALVNNIPVAYAVTYLVGTAVLVWFIPNVGPRLMGVNLKEESREVQAQMAGGTEPGLGVVRAHTVRGPCVPGDERADW